MLAIIFILPFLTFLIVSLMGRRLGVYGSRVIIFISIFMSTLSALITAEKVILSGAPSGFWFGTWWDTGSVIAAKGLIINPDNAWLIGTVYVVSLLVHIFAFVYMEKDPNPQKFFGWLLLFTGFMVVLIGACDLPLLFLGWEGINVSYITCLSNWIPIYILKKVFKATVIFSSSLDHSTLLLISLINLE